ncbi:amidohydrolase family protein [Microbacterium lacticum]
MHRVVEGARAVGVRPGAVDREEDTCARGLRVDGCEDPRVDARLHDHDEAVAVESVLLVERGAEDGGEAGEMACVQPHARERRGGAAAQVVDGALLAFSTDAPTAPHDALANMYVATTRASALDPSVPATHPQYALPIESALGHATRDAATSVGDGAWRGRIAPGCAADFAIVDTDVFAAEPAALLRARIVETVVAGTRRHG